MKSSLLECVAFLGDDMLFWHSEFRELCIMVCQIRVEQPLQKSKFSTVCYSTLFFICHILVNDGKKEELSERHKEGRHRKRKRRRTWRVIKHKEREGAKDNEDSGSNEDITFYLFIFLSIFLWSICANNT